MTGNNSLTDAIGEWREGDLATGELQDRIGEWRDQASVSRSDVGADATIYSRESFSADFEPGLPAGITVDDLDLSGGGYPDSRPGGFVRIYRTDGTDGLHKVAIDSPAADDGDEFTDALQARPKAVFRNAAASGTSRTGREITNTLGVTGGPESSGPDYQAMRRRMRERAESILSDAGIDVDRWNVDARAGGLGDRTGFILQDPETDRTRFIEHDVDVGGDGDGGADAPADLPARTDHDRFRPGASGGGSTGGAGGMGRGLAILAAVAVAFYGVIQA